MTEFVSANLPLLLIGLMLALIALWFVIASTRRTRVTIDRRDTLDEGAAPAARNQALIDAAPAATPLPPIVPEALGAVGAAVAATIDAVPVEASADAGDDLTRIKGLGPKIAATLRELGVTRFAQIAAWSDVDVERIDAHLGRFAGRIRRDAWIEQAELLAAGDTAEFEARFGAR